MIIECATIALIIAMMSFIFLRTKKRPYALVTLPLLSVPVMHVIGALIAEFAMKDQELSVRIITVLAADLLGLLVGGLLLGMLVNNIKNKKARFSFLIISAVFMVALAIVLMIDQFGN